MKSLSLLAGVGLASFFLFLISSLPAKVLTDLSASSGVRVGGVTGTVWNGEARRIEVPGFRLSRTAWKISPASLLLGRLAAAVEADWPGGKANGDLTVGLTGSVSLRNFEAAGEVAPIAQQMNLPQTGGQFFANVVDLQIVDDWPRTVIADLRVENVPLALIGVSSAPTGSYEVSFAADEVVDQEPVIGEIKDLSGPLEISGNVTLSPPTNYEVMGRITPRQDAPSDLVKGLALLGPAAPDGSREFSLAGSL